MPAIRHSMEPLPTYQPKYVMLNDNNNPQNPRPPPQRRNVPRYDGHHGSGCGWCCRCICCCCCFWIILITILALFTLLLYTYLNPMAPEYDVQKFQVSMFDVQQQDLSLYTEFVVTVRAYNPNEHISMTYGEGSSVVLSYEDSTLCSGKLPAYHQPYKNTTITDVTLTGKSEFGSGLQQALMENKDTGRIPLLMRVRAPVSVVVDDLPLREVVVYVNCSLVIDNLAPHKPVRILSSSYSYSVGIN